MGKIGKAHVDGKAASERPKIRRELGPLRSVTVQPKTRQRYDKASEQFLDFLRKERLELPRQASRLDGLLSDYIEFL